MPYYYIQPYSPLELKKRHIDRLEFLYRQLFKSDPERARQIRYADVWRALERDRMWIAHTESVIVAMGFLIPNIKPIVAESFGSVQDVVTDEKHRGKVHNGQSLAESILGEMIRYAKAQRFKYLELTSAPDRIAANRLYQNLGFRLIAHANPDDEAGTNLYRLYLTWKTTII